jgi:cytochrome c oxidase subunit II
MWEKGVENAACRDCLAARSAAAHHHHRRADRLRPARLLAGAGLVALAAGCDSVDATSALAPAGPEAEAIAALFRVMLAAGAVIWLAVTASVLYAARRGRRTWSREAAGKMILWAGAVLPATALLVLLAYALWIMPGLRPWASAAQSDGLRVEIVGHQYWWQVIYHPAGGDPVSSANEVRMPAGERVEFVLRSADVIHSFWIPPLGGKMDLIPGRTNRLTLQADAPGRFRGVCAEFCGSAHARMAFAVEAMARPDFDAWLAAEAGASPGAEAAEGRELFLANGCGACHTVRGTPARGTIGPDLSHVGGRTTLAAGTLAVTRDAIADFVAVPEAFKPGAAMPAYGMLPEAELQALAGWLEGLE